MTPGGLPSSCEDVQAFAAELALGTLPGSERASAVSHLEICGGCREVVDGLSKAADALLLTARAVDPPVGFEVRLLDRLGGGTSALPTPITSARKRRGRAIAAVAAIAIGAAGVGVGIGAGVTGTTNAPVTANGVGSRGPVHVAALKAAGSGRPAGQAVLAAGHPGMLVMAVRDMSSSGRVRCVLTSASGTAVVGNFQLYDGSGTWWVPLPRSWHAADVDEARLVSDSGEVVASARFH
ncbi:MAG: hypothetical protein ACRDZ5_12385 [Acidimicrobiales bacterium]